MSEEITTEEKVRALYGVARYRPLFTVGVVGLSIFAAMLEGIGLSFLLPIIELARGDIDPATADGALGLFVTAYEFLGISFTLEAVVVGVTVVMTARYTSSFLVAWLRAALKTTYVRHLQVEAFDHALDARVEYFDAEGSDDILNAIVTQATLAGRVIERVVQFIEQAFLTAMYGAVALYFAPRLTLGSVLLLGIFALLSRTVLESGYSVGDRVADANEEIQTAAQAGTQGIRDVKLFGLGEELFERFRTAADQYTNAQIRLSRNEAALSNFYELGAAVIVFLLLYVALALLELPLASLGVFLFAMFRLAPRASTLNNYLYKIESDLPHLVRTQHFVEELAARAEPDGATEPVPDPIERIAFEDVSFSYESDDHTIRDLTLSVDSGEFVAFVGPSGAGKSTIVSLLAGLYEPDDGEITADGTPITAFDLREWRENVAVVRQQPFVFNDTLRYNVTVGNREASQAEIERACETAQVTEFLDGLPNGYDTVLGDDGVRLSGGQRQRIAIARALLKDADVLVLDEATSDLDTSLEEAVHAGIESMERDCSMFVVAHRLSTVRNADRIYAMEDGSVVESGFHTALLEADGVYAKLYGAQQ
ncbi:ABC transporter ATP-binding protein [Halosimplex salinum]|uniref:ABC transporter ATP-binding protein n=1 Tax=Halosimplex salinum TaxID=1710538 RepID=UPI000F4816D7|nr:ABC transporter ATP-binding protein [Halosimplex salinum]